MRHLNLSITLGLDIVTDSGTRFTVTNNFYIPPPAGPGLLARLIRFWHTWGLGYLPG